MKSKMSKKLIAFILCMVLVICNSVSILADTPAPETATVEKQVKETKTANDRKASDDEAGDTENVSPQSEESAPEVKTTEKKEETTEATTQKKDEADEVTTKAKEETEKADETTTEAKETTKKEETTETQEEKTTKAKEETSETSGKKDTEKTTEAEEKTAPTELTYDDENVTVTVSAVAEGAIPADATLKVVPILKDDAETKDQYTEVEQKIQEKAAETETEIKGFLAYDITFVDADGNEIEPNSEVKVSMEYKEAALPAEITAEDAKTSEVSVMHLEEDDAGNVSKVVDMGEAGKVDTLETTDAKQVEKVEVKTESFSVFTITWQYGRYEEFNIGVNYGYFDENNKWNELKESDFGNSVELPDKLELVDHDENNPLDLAQYQVPIDGYSYLATRVNNEKNGDEVKSLFVSQEDYDYGMFGSGIYYYVNYIDINNASHEQWLSSSIMGEQEGKVYFIYEKTGLEIEDNIIENGTLNAVFKGLSEDDLEGVTYVWSRSDEEDGAYTEVEKKNYQGGVSNLSEDGSELYPAYDEGARKWYKVKATLADGTVIESKPFQVPYFNELQNGSFETPAYRTTDVYGENTPETMTQVSNENYKDEGIWQTTGISGGKDIEILGVGKQISHEGQVMDGLSAHYAWQKGQTPAAADGVQFAELNCQTAGALYQDVLTIPGTPLNYALSHRARGDYNDITEYDTMFLVIMPTKDSQDLVTQEQLEDKLQKGLGIDINAHSTTKEHKEIVYNQDGILVMRITSDDQNWNDISEIGKYVPTTSATRFFFMAGKTAATVNGTKKGNTIGNFLDDVFFSQKLPEVSDGEFSLQINKKFEGIGESDRQKVEEQLQFQITAQNTATGEGLNSDEIEQLFGKKFVTGKDSDVIHNADGSLTWNIAYRTIDNDADYTVTLVELNAGLSGYNVITQADNRVVTGEGESPGEGATFTLTSGTTAYVNFTNTYERNENKTVNFTKVWDDGTYGAITRPDSLDVTLKPTITVYKNNEWKTIELTSDDLGGIGLTKTITGNKTAKTWTTSWDVPVYYDGDKANGVKVKIDYTVVEGKINSDYVYEADSEEALTGNGSEYTSKFNSSGDTITSAEPAPSQKSSRAAVAAMAAAASTKAAKGADSTASDDLGEPVHNKYIEYNESTNDYTLNLDVTGAKGEAKGVDVLFVIDTSGSMAGSGFWGTGGLLSSTKELLTKENGIIDQIFKADGNVNSVAYVSFAGKSETRANGWYNTNNSEDLKEDINDLYATGGTNWTYAMQRASSVLAQRANNGNEKVVIFLSDGEPTYTMSGNRQTGSGSSTRDYYYTDAADAVKNSSSLKAAKIYSVYLTSSTETGMNYFAELLQGRGVDAESKNGTNLETALNDILDIIIPTYKNVTITDTLSGYVDFVGEKITVTKRAANGTETELNSNQYTANISEKTITVILKDNEERALDDGATYTVSFKVKPNETAENYYAEYNGYPDKGDPGTGATSADQEGFHSNNGATVTYTVNNETDTADYPDPVVQVTTHNLTIEKKWNHPAEVEEPNGDVDVVVTFTDGTSRNITLTKNKDYKETLTNEPVTRKIATVEETSKFDNYEPSYQYSADGTTATVINNYSKLTTRNIVVNKVWEGNGPKSDVQVVLYRSVNGGDAEQFKTETLTEGKWSVTWSNLVLEESDTATGVHNTYTYAVREVNIPAGYNSSISYDYNSSSNTTTATITNTYDTNCADENYYIANVLQTEKLNISKTWEDNDNAAGLRPDSVSVNINDGNGGYYNETLNEGDSWHKTLTVLKKKNRTYTATETMNGANTDRYTMGNEGNAVVDGTNISFTNTLKSTSITVKKEWKDNDVADRPTGIEFKLEYSDDEGKTWHPYGEGEVWEDAEGGTEEGDSATPVPGTYILLKENIIYDKDGNATEWARTFTNLPIQYEYRVKEVNVPGQYYSEVTSETGDGNTTFTITNILKWSLKKTNSPEEGEEAVVLQGANFELKQGNTVIATGISGQDGVVDWNVKTDSTTDKPYDLQSLNGVYVLTETKAPTGYQGLTTITWKLHFDDDVLTSAASYKGNDPLVGGDNENAKDPYITLTSSSETGVVITVQNDLLYELPETGGSGTYWYTLSGTLLMAGAALIVYRQKRKREVLLRK